MVHQHIPNILQGPCRNLLTSPPTYNVRSLIWIFSRKYLTIFSRYLLLIKAPSKVFDRVLNTPLEYAYCVYIVQGQFVKVMWFKGLYRRFERIPEFGKVVFIVELYEEIPPLFSLFLKMLETCFFFRSSSNYQCQWAKRQKSFILYQSKHSFHYLAKKWEYYCHLSTCCVVGPACTVRKQIFLKT